MGKLFDKESIIDIAKQSSLNDTDKYRRPEFLDKEKIANGIEKGAILAAKGVYKMLEGTVNAAEDARAYIVDVMPEHLEEKFREYLKKEQESYPECNHLTLIFDIEDCGFFAVKEKAYFSVVDTDFNQIFYANGRDNKRKQHITVFNSANQVIGEIVEKSKFMDMGESNYVIKTSSGQTVSMKSLPSLFGEKYKITPLEWFFHKSGVGKYEVLDNSENVVVRYTYKPFSAGQVLHMEYSSKESEVLVVLLALSIYANGLMTERHPHRHLE